MPGFTYPAIEFRKQFFCQIGIAESIDNKYYSQHGGSGSGKHGAFRIRVISKYRGERAPDPLHKGDETCQYGRQGIGNTQYINGKYNFVRHFRHVSQCGEGNDLMGSPLFSRAIAKGQPQSAGIDSGGQPDFRTTQDSDHQDDGQGGTRGPISCHVGQ